jgi:hypothetical protein
MPPSEDADEKKDSSAFVPTSSQIHFKVLQGEDAAAVNQVDGHLVDVTETASLLLDCSVALPFVKTRQPHVLKDSQGNEKKYGSALGLLTRKFVDLLHVSS